MKKQLCITTLLLFGLISFQLCMAKEKKHSVKIVTDSHIGIFPKSWLTKKINAKGELLKKSEVERSRKVLNIALHKYPQRVLTKNLDTIYALHKLEYLGISAGGTNSTRDVYVANPGIEKGYSDRWVERVFHAEFSSILLRKFPRYLNKTRWHKINGKSFKYGGDGVQAVKNKKSSTKFDEASHKEGFLHEYAKSTLENDLNAISAQLFLGSKQFWKVVKKHKKLEQKTNLVIAFYHNVDPSLDKDYFVSLVETDRMISGVATSCSFIYLKFRVLTQHSLFSFCEISNNTTFFAN